MRALSLLVLIAAACGPNAQQGGDPPVCSIDFTATWMVTDLRRLDGTAPLAIDPGTPAAPFRPLFEGMLLEFAGGQLLDRTGQPLFAEWRAGVANERYTNSTQGRFFVFDSAGSGGDPCPWHEELRVSGNVATPTIIQGGAQISSASDCSEPAPLPPEATGQFSFTLRFVSLPAGPDDAK